MGGSTERIADRYEYVGEAGRGATGRVLRVRDRWQGGRLRAAKVVDRRHEATLRWEFERLRAVSSPFVVQAHELVRLARDLPEPFALAAGTVVLVEDWVEGATLRDVLRQQHDEAARTQAFLHLCAGLAEGLAALHAVGLLHRDVKPANVRVVREQGASGRALRPVLLDLGLSAPPGVADHAAGTPGFMAPEAWGGVYGEASDLFALGATLAASWPDAGGTDEVRESSPSTVADGEHAQRALAEALRARQRWLRRSEGLPRRLRDLVAWLLEPDPVARPASAAQLAERVRAWLPGAGPRGATVRAVGGRSVRPTRLPLVGRAGPARRLARRLETEGVLLVAGPAGSGRTRLVSEAVARLQRRLVERGEAPPTFARWRGRLPEKPPGGRAIWLLEAPAGLGTAEAERLVRAARLLGGRLTVVLEVDEPGAGAPAVPVVRLGPLQEEDLARLLGHLLGGPPDRSVLEAARRRCGGLPGRLVRLAERLRRAGEPLDRASSWEAAAVEEDASALAGIRALAPRGRALAERLAVAGGAMPLEALADDERIADLLESGLAVLEVGAAVLRPDVAAALRETLPPRRRRARAREVMEGARLRDASAAFVGWVLGERRADERGARAIHTLHRSGAAARAGRFGMELLGWVEQLGRRAEAEATALATAEAWRSVGDYRRALDALQGLDGPRPTWLRAELLRLSGARDEARELLAEQPASPAFVALAARLALDEGCLERAERMAREALAVGEAADRRASGRAREVLALVALAQGRLPQAEAEARAAVALVEALEPAEQLRARGLLATVRSRAGGASALRRLEEVAERADGLGERHLAAVYRFNAALGRLGRGEVGPALEGLRRAATALAVMGRPGELGRVLLATCSARLLAGDVTGAETALEALRPWLPDAGDPDLELLVAVAGLEVASASRDGEARGRRGPRRSPGRLVSMAERAGAAAASVGLARAALVFAWQGEARIAERLLGRWRKLPEHARAGGAAADAALAGGWLALHAGDLQDAETHLQRAARWLEDEGADVAERRLQLAWLRARLGERRGEPLPQAWAEARALLEHVAGSLDEGQRALLRASPLAARALSLGARPQDASGERTQAWRQVAEASARLVAATGSEALARRLLAAAREATGAERAFLLRRGEGGRWTLLAARGVRGRALPTTGEAAPTVSRTLLGRAWSRGGSLVAVDAGAEDDLREAGSVHRAALRSVLVVPLPRFSGALVLDDRLRAGAFSAEAVARAEVLGEVFEGLAARGEGRRDTSGMRGPRLVGRSAALRELQARAARVADAEAPILLLGESGTGKELLARWLHARSRRAEGPFVPVACGALPEGLAESLLFGHAEGAFTGAREARAGLLEAAADGTLFLDDLTALSTSVQAALLRVLQQGEFRRVGETRVRRADVRVVAASREPLQQAVAEGRFREDLYYRVAVLVLEIPPLRERLEDLEPLVAHFVERLGVEPAPWPTEAAWELLRAHPWPGNVRQLEAEVQRWVALGLREVGPEDLSVELRGGGQGAGRAAVEQADLRARLRAYERRLVREALLAEGGNVTRTARRLGLSRYGLQKAMRRLGLER